MPIVKTTHLILALLFASVPAYAELKWEQTTVELNPAVGDKQAVGHFKYQNVGKTPVRFKAVRTSCGCTAAQTQKDEVPPGEKGEITATFSIGDRTGAQVKTVTVETDDPKQTSTVLTLKANLPETLAITPTFLYWAPGEGATAKTIMVKAGKNFPAKKLTATSTNADFVTKVESKSDGVWSISVEPKQTEKMEATTIAIQTDLPKDAPKIYYASARVTGSTAVAR